MPKINKKDANVFYGTIVVDVIGGALQLSFENDPNEGDDVVYVDYNTGHTIFTTREGFQKLVEESNKAKEQPQVIEEKSPIVNTPANESEG